MRDHRVRYLFALLALAIPIASISCKLVTGGGEESSATSIIKPLASETNSGLVSEIPETAIPLGDSSPGEGSDWSQNATKPASDLSEILHFKGQLGGVSYAVDQQGGIAYLGVGPRLMAIDISNPANPTQLGQTEVLDGIVYGVDVEGNYAYVAAGKAHLYVLDISDPRNIQPRARLDDFQWAQQPLKVGNRLYIADNPQGLWIADVSDPLNPTILGSINLRLPASSLAVNGNYVYLTNLSGSLEVVDASDPTNPVSLNSIAVDQLVSSIAIADGYAYLAGGADGLVVLDLGDPSNPIKLGSYKTAWADGVAVDGKNVYLADNLAGVLVFDRTNPANPQLLGSISDRLFGQGLPVQRQMLAQESRVLVADKNQGLLIINASVPESPYLEGVYNAPVHGFPMDVTCQADKAYNLLDTLGLSIADVSNPSLPRELGTDYSTVQAGLRTPRQAVVVGNLVYIADVNHGLRIYDVSNASQPSEIGAFNPEDNGKIESVVVAGIYAYVPMNYHDPRPEQQRGLRVIDVSNPSAPREVGRLALPYNAYRLALQGNHLFYPDFLEMKERGNLTELRVIDVSNPAQPVQIGSYDTSGPVQVDTTLGQAGVAMGAGLSSLAVQGKVLYLGDPYSGLHVIDISNPSQPQRLANWSEYPMFMDLAIADNWLFSASYGAVLVIDVSNPANPQLTQMYRNPGLAMGIDVQGNLVCVADGDGGLLLLDYAP